MGSAEPEPPPQATAHDSVHVQPAEAVTARPGGLSPTSPSYRSDCSPARPERSGKGPAHRNGGAGTTTTSATASAFDRAPRMSTDHAAAPGGCKVPDRVK